MSMKNSNYTIGNRTRDLSACSAVPQPTAPPLAPNLKYIPKVNKNFETTVTKNTALSEYFGIMLNSTPYLSPGGHQYRRLRLSYDMCESPKRVLIVAGYGGDETPFSVWNITIKIELL
jgi:hypothetical protein